MVADPAFNARPSVELTGVPFCKPLVAVAPSGANPAELIDQVASRLGPVPPV